MFNQTATIFNRHESTWYPTVLDNVHVEWDRKALNQKYGLDSNTRCEVFIHQLDEYRPARQWHKVLDGYTLQTGKDLMLIGGWIDETPIEDSDYQFGFQQHLIEEYDDVFLVSGFTGIYGTIPHIEVSGAGI